MRNIGLTLTAFFFASLTAPAQNSPPTTPMPNPERLEKLLEAWEKRMSTVDNFTTKSTRTVVRFVDKKATTYIGEAAFMKPNMARIDMTHQDEVGKKDADKTNFERMFCNGQYIYEYVPRDKKIIIHDIPKNEAATDNLILAFLRGMKAADAKKRFNLTLTKETEWYAYLYITPKSDADRQEFKAAQLTIFVKNPNPANAPNLVMMPCRIWYQQPNGNEVTYLFADMQPNGKLEKDAFVPRQIPGYTVERANAGAIQPMPKTPPK